MAKYLIKVVDEVLLLKKQLILIIVIINRLLVQHVVYLFWILNPKSILSIHHATESVEEEGVLLGVELAAPRVQLIVFKIRIVRQFISFGNHWTLQRDAS